MKGDDVKLAQAIIDGVFPPTIRSKVDAMIKTKGEPVRGKDGGITTVKFKTRMRACQECGAPTSFGFMCRACRGETQFGVRAYPVRRCV